MSLLPFLLFVCMMAPSTNEDTPVNYRNRFLNSAAIALLLVAGVSSCDPAAAAERTVYASQPGENVDEFIVRVARQAVAMTRVSKVEFCGAIGFRGDDYAMYLDRGDRNSCTVRTDDVPEGYLPTGEVFHTHPDSPHFSPADYAVPGYMAHGARVMHQHGRDTLRRVR